MVIISGGAFYENYLYICTNIDDGIWKINIETGDIEFVVSDNYPLHEYEVHNNNYIILILYNNIIIKMEGLDFWDLSSIGLGVMHM